MTPTLPEPSPFQKGIEKIIGGTLHLDMELSDSSSEYSSSAAASPAASAASAAVSAASEETSEDASEEEGGDDDDHDHDDDEGDRSDDDYGDGGDDGNEGDGDEDDGDIEDGSNGMVWKGRGRNDAVEEEETVTIIDIEAPAGMSPPSAGMSSMSPPSSSSMNQAPSTLGPPPSQRGAWQVVEQQQAVTSSSSPSRAPSANKARSLPASSPAASSRCTVDFSKHTAGTLNTAKQSTATATTTTTMSASASSRKAPLKVSSPVYMTRKELARRRAVAKVKARTGAKTKSRNTGAEDTNDTNDDNDRSGHDTRSSSPARGTPAAVVVRRGRGGAPSSLLATTQEEGPETATGQVDTQCSWLILGDCYKVR
jgi:hypothetical protein